MINKTVSFILSSILHITLLLACFNLGKTNDPQRIGNNQHIRINFVPIATKTKLTEQLNHKTNNTEKTKNKTGKKQNIQSPKSPSQKNTPAAETQKLQKSVNTHNNKQLTKAQDNHSPTPKDTKITTVEKKAPINTQSTRQTQSSTAKPANNTAPAQHKNISPSAIHDAATAANNSDKESANRTEEKSINDWDNMLVTLDEMKTSNPPYVSNINNSSNSEISVSETDAIISRIENEWNISNLRHHKEIKNMTAIIDITLNDDGSIHNINNRENHSLSGNKLYKLFVSTAVGAIHDAAPFEDLPKERYKHWRRITITFSADQLTI